jgi:hypothetical protein
MAKATAKDAQLILQLYDLRREPEMRKARSWWLTDFWPSSADEFVKVAFAMGTPENNWLRQVPGYWSIAASFVLEGALSEELFLRPSFSGEMFVIFGKVYPFLGDEMMFADIEKVIGRTKWGRERLKFMVQRLATWRERIQKKG